MSAQRKGNKQNSNGYVMASDETQWIKPLALGDDADDDFKRIFVFYVINTPCKDLSARSIEFSKYGLDKNFGKNDKQRKYVFEMARLETNTTLKIAKNFSEMRDACQKTKLDDEFYNNFDVERIAAKKNGNQFISILYHIRNAFAHGRFAIKQCRDGTDKMFIMEDLGRGRKVSARMILKKSTLLRWMEIIKTGRFPEG